MSTLPIGRLTTGPPTQSVSRMGSPKGKQTRYSANHPVPDLSSAGPTANKTFQTRASPQTPSSANVTKSMSIAVVIRPLSGPLIADTVRALMLASTWVNPIRMMKRWQKWPSISEFCKQLCFFTNIRHRDAHIAYWKAHGNRPTDPLHFEDGFIQG